MKSLSTLSLGVLVGLAASALQPTWGAPFNKPNTKTATPPNYVGASISSADTEQMCGALLECSEEKRSWKVYSGVRITEKIMFEGGYIQFGEHEGKINQQAHQQKLTGYSAAGLATYPLSNDIELYGKAGMVWWTHELTNSTGEQKNKGNDLFYGVGAQYNLGGNLGLRAEWERFEGLQQDVNATETSVDLLSLGFTYSSL